MNIGLKGERKAALLYKKLGFRILSLNFTTKQGELDIIAKKDNLIVFCEVKTRISLKYGQPFEAVTYYKQQKIKQLAQIFLKKVTLDNENIRFDVVSIISTQSGNIISIEHIENAF